MTKRRPLYKGNAIFTNRLTGKFWQVNTITDKVDTYEEARKQAENFQAKYQDDERHICTDIFVVTI